MAGSVGSEDGDMGFQIAPMVDVVFVLMLFFMASAGQQITENELNIALPSGQSSSDSKNPIPIIIDISADGQVTMNKQSFGTPADKKLEPLRAWLKNAREQFGGDDPVIVRPTPETRHERIIDVLNAAAAAGVTKLSFS
jgi:biopolymer transport protein ExbD